VHANVFIQAKNLHYGLDFCPAFWDWLITTAMRAARVQHRQGGAMSSPRAPTS
jgi:hypothetical protein